MNTIKNAIVHCLKWYCGKCGEECDGIAGLAAHKLVCIFRGDDDDD